jgi:hypothetical protein
MGGGKESQHAKIQDHGQPDCRVWHWQLCHIPETPSLYTRAAISAKR